MNATYQIGDLVTASYKTGGYIGEIAEAPSVHKAAVRILAVIKHPTQGDLHHPMDADVPFFHQRRALSFQEIALMPLHTIEPYSGEVPEYKQSLRQALQADIEQLQAQNNRFSQRCLEELRLLEQEYSL
ncbi:sporulation phosphorelay system protein KapB [Paenibacillus thalictri]|uniref:Kinase n=1 Tax=Paenibacillus thalictri TaxID=2527873 RepID=A0A4Q9DYD9_9BACL|nr:sporulation phosphorelay system protein KapB [Paenibacillus thalictri]TBL80260.1 kinase [Paenibacillus thalictri]